MAKKYALGLLLLLSLLASTSPNNPAAAAPDEVKWSRVNIPTEGKAGDWVLASGSEAQHLTMAIDGTLYAYANPSGTSYTLFKSTDDGYSWSYTGKVNYNIVDIACSSIDADIIYITDSNYVYKSDDAGDSFDEVAANSLENLNFASSGEEITCLDVGYKTNDAPYVFIGTANTTNGNFGGVYYIAEADFGAEWTDLNAGNYDVYSIACSPDFKDDSEIIAIVTDEQKTYVVNNYSVIGDWTDKVELLDASGNSFAITAASNICFPSGFDETYELFIGVIGGDGGIYRADKDSSYRLDVDADIISLDLVGEVGDTQLLAGEYNDAEVWYSTDDGDSWDSTDKPPSGSGPTYVVMVPDFSSNGKAYAATSGTESALSITWDGGVTWNQISLIDTALSTILDLAPSPNYSQDNALFMLTFDGGHVKHSLWRSLNSGTEWERVFTSALSNVDSLNLVELSPQYGNDSQVIFVAGSSNGNPAIWKSTDNGQSFIRRTTRDPDTGVHFNINIWAVVNDNTLFVGSYDGSNGLVYYTTNSGSSYSNGAVVGSNSLNSIALSPDYEQDETILVGNTNGWVYWSNDNGTSFEPLPPDATSPPLTTGSISVAFDPEFSNNNTIYAASNTEATTDDKERIYRFIIGKSTTWESIDSTLSDETTIDQLMVSADGTLYAINSKPDGGMERSLNPTYSLGPTFETVTRGLDDGATLTGLWLCDNQLWSIEEANTRLMTYTDSLTLPVTLTSPPDEAPGIDTRNAHLDWETLDGATSYQWQLDYDTDFSAVLSENSTKASSARLPALEPDTTYYWRVRATEPVISPWSAKWLFTTGLGSEVTAPELYSPEAGASGVLLKPVFQWSAIAGADSYELLVSTDPSLINPTIAKIEAYALPSTAWQCDVSLNGNTTYYWKVRAVNSDTFSDWSAVGAFTTESPPSLTPPSPPPPTPEPPPTPPLPSPQPTIPHWIIYLVGGLLLTIILLLIITLVLVTGIRRP